MAPWIQLQRCFLALSLYFLLFHFFYISNTSIAVFADNYSSSDLVNQVCSKTEYVTYCVTVLNSGVGSSQADIKGLAHITFEIAYMNATNTRGYINQLLQQDIPSLVKEGLLQCGYEYGKAIANIQTALQDLDAGTHKEVNLLATFVHASARTCERVFIEGPTHKSPLTANNEDLMKLSDIATVISGLIP